MSVTLTGGVCAYSADEVGDEAADRHDEFCEVFIGEIFQSSISSCVRENEQ
jgi:hypothetical protein